MEIARAVIVATHSDDRPWCSVGGRPKPLLPVATKPILFHTLESLQRAGVLEAALVAGEQADALLRDGLRSHIAAFARDAVQATALMLVRDGTPQPRPRVACGYLLSAEA